MVFGATAPVAASAPLLKTWRRASPSSVLFYLHGAGPFDFRPEVSTYIRAVGRVHEAYRPSFWQHSVDTFLVPALYDHPARTRSASESALHVLALIPTAAMYVHNTTQRLEQRMAAVVRSLLDGNKAAATMWANTSVQLLVFAPSEVLVSQVGGPLAGLLRSRPNVRIASCDQGFGGVRPNVPYSSLYRKALPLPYLVRPSLSRFAATACIDHATAAEHKVGTVVFHGDTGRYDGGMRAQMRLELAYRGRSQ